MARAFIGMPEVSEREARKDRWEDEMGACGARGREDQLTQWQCRRLVESGVRLY